MHQAAVCVVLAYSPGDPVLKGQMTPAPNPTATPAVGLASPVTPSPTQSAISSICLNPTVDAIVVVGQTTYAFQGKTSFPVYLVSYFSKSWSLMDIFK